MLDDGYNSKRQSPASQQPTCEKSVGNDRGSFHMILVNPPGGVGREEVTMTLFKHTHTTDMKLLRLIVVLMLMVKRHLTSNTQLIIFNGRMFAPEGPRQLPTRWQRCCNPLEGWLPLHTLRLGFVFLITIATMYQWQFEIKAGVCACLFAIEHHCNYGNIYTHRHTCTYIHTHMHSNLYTCKQAKLNSYKKHIRIHIIHKTKGMNRVQTQPCICMHPLTMESGSSQLKRGTHCWLQTQCRWQRAPRRCWRQEGRMRQGWRRAQRVGRRRVWEEQGQGLEPSASAVSRVRERGRENQVKSSLTTVSTCPWPHTCTSWDMKNNFLYVNCHKKGTLFIDNIPTFGNHT